MDQNDRPENRPSVQETIATLPYFWRLIWRAEPKSATILLSAALAQAPIAAATVWGMTNLIAGLANGAHHQVIFGAITLVIAGLASVGVSYFTNYHSDRLRYATEISYSALGFQHVSRLPFATLENPEFQRYLTAFDRNGWVITNLSEQTRRVLGELLTVIGYGTALLIVPWQAAVVMLLAIATKVLLLRKAADSFWEVFDMETKAGRRANYFSNAIIGPSALSARVIGVNKRFMSAWQGLVDKMLIKRYQSVRLSAKANLLSGLVEAGGFGTGLLIVLGTAGQASAGPVAAFVAAYRQAGSAIDGLVGNIDWFLKYAHSFPLIKKFYDQPEESDAGQPMPAGPLTIRFDNIWFRYPGASKDVLCGITFELNQGEDVALVGLNGAGKSTLLRLLLGTYRPTQGRILINGIDLATIKPSAWREAIAMLPQDMPAYDDTIEAQVLYGDQAGLKRADRLDIALAASGLAELAQSLPKGLATHAGRHYSMPEDQAIELSGGQRQIVSIARTLYRDAQLYVFDEPTSAVDAEKEERFFESLPEALAGRTAVFVAHRFSTIRRAKRIIVMDAGQIIEDGTHEELMAKSGRYAELFTLQARLYQ